MTVNFARKCSKLNGISFQITINKTDSCPPRASEVSIGRVGNFITGQFFMYVVYLSITSNSSHRFETRGLKLCIKTHHINAKKVQNQMFEIISGGWDMGVSQGKQVCTCWRVYTWWASDIWGVYMQNFKFQPSCFQTEGGERGDWRRDI